MVPSFTKDESENVKKIQTAVNAIMDPAIDKVVIGQATMADWDKAVQDAIKAGAPDLEKIYNEAEAPRVEHCRSPCNDSSASAGSGLWRPYRG